MRVTVQLEFVFYGHKITWKNPCISGLIHINVMERRSLVDVELDVL